MPDREVTNTRPHKAAEIVGQRPEQNRDTPNIWPDFMPN